MEPHSGLNDLDYIVIGIILLSGFLALMRGFVRELFSLIAWVGAYFAATKFYLPFVPYVHHHIKNEKAAEWVAMASVFVVALILLVILGSLVCGLVKGRTLTLVDRSLGFAYGIARGALVVCLIYLCAVMILWPDIDAPPDTLKDKDRNVPPELLMQAKTRPLLASGAGALMVLVPKDMIDQTIKNLEEKKDNTVDEKQEMLDRLSTPALPQPSDHTLIDTTKAPAPESKP